VLGLNDLAPELHDKALSELTIIGVLGIFDPPRAESAEPSLVSIEAVDS
jgi:hypothetical protein